LIPLQFQQYNSSPWWQENTNGNWGWTGLTQQRSWVLTAPLTVVFRFGRPLALVLSCLSGLARAEGLKAEPPPGPLYRCQTNPTNNPKAIVGAMLARDLKKPGTLHRVERG